MELYMTVIDVFVGFGTCLSGYARKTSVFAMSFLTRQLISPS